MIKLEINHKLAGLVPMANAKEQEILNEDIEKNGQIEPIVLWQGKIIDGRCRNLACILLGLEPKIRELPWNTTEEEARALVKSLNTRRNLTQTQKIISACRVSMDSLVKTKLKEVAKEWGISETILKNARHIAKERPEFVDPLFNGESVQIVSQDGEEVYSSKISTIYAFVKRNSQSVKEDRSHGWNPNSNINTQAGKDWYYAQIKIIGNADVIVKMHMVELANYKFQK